MSNGLYFTECGDPSDYANYMDDDAAKVVNSTEDPLSITEDEANKFEPVYI